MNSNPGGDDGLLRVLQRRGEYHPTSNQGPCDLLRALVNFEQTDETQAIFSAIAASPEPDLPGYAGVLEVLEDGEHLLPEEGESRHGIGCGSDSFFNISLSHSDTP
jgi:hypothetical protein